MASPFDRATDVDDIEDAATVLMTGAELEDELRELRDLYQRHVAGKDRADEPESASEAAAFRLVADGAPFEIGPPEMERTLVPPGQPSRPWGLYAAVFVGVAALVGAAALFV